MKSHVRKLTAPDLLDSKISRSEEARRMDRIPGVVFADGPTGRRAVVGDTGLDVWEIVATWQASACEFDELRQNYDWLSESQLRTALAYYAAYPHDIDTRLTREAEWTPERIASDPIFGSIPPRR